MITKNHAVEKIDEIYQVIQKNFLVMLPGKLLIAIGTAIMTIPFFELLLSWYIDPLLISAGITSPFIFVLRTLFYWTSFALLSKCFDRQDAIHPAIKKAWGLNNLFPIVPVATAGMLALTGNTELIMPIVLIFVGCFLAQIGRFAGSIITLLACTLITVGIGSIYLTTLAIPHLWMYLLIFQGIMSIIAGCALQTQQQTTQS